MDDPTIPQQPENAAPDPASVATDPVGAAPGDQQDELKRLVVEAICLVYDPEIPVNIYELGLIYDVDVTPESDAKVSMTLTSPMCPVAESLPIDVEMRVKAVDGINNVTVDLTWDPPWNPEMMSEAAKLELGFM